MNNTSRILLSLISSLLISCSLPIEGEWVGIEMTTSIDDETQTKTFPYEECYPAIDPETGSLSEDNPTCVARDLLLSITNKDEGSLELVNDTGSGHIVNIQTVWVSSDEFSLSDTKNFDFTCVLESSDLTCDFRSSIGYLQESLVLFQPMEN
jgi:hypothetical protein